MPFFDFGPGWAFPTFPKVQGNGVLEVRSSARLSPKKALSDDCWYTEMKKRNCSTGLHFSRFSRGPHGPSWGVPGEGQGGPPGPKIRRPSPSACESKPNRTPSAFRASYVSAFRASDVCRLPLGGVNLAWEGWKKQIRRPSPSACENRPKSRVGGIGVSH